MTSQTPTTEDALAGVTQADRDAAADLMATMPFGGLVGSEDVREGGDDQHKFVQAFARHRLSAQPVAQGGWRSQEVRAAILGAIKKLRGSGESEEILARDGTTAVMKLLAAAPKPDALAGGPEDQDFSGYVECPEEDAPDREAIARIIEPYGNWERRSFDDSKFQHDREVAFAKADEIIAALTPAAPADGGWSAAINQNAAMREELAHVGNLVSDLARAMKVDRANDDGSWPGLAGRIEKLIQAALTPSARLSEGEMERLRYLSERATLGDWMVQDGCSWRRIGTHMHDGDVLCPIVQRDGHPDLMAADGKRDANMHFIVAAVNHVRAALSRAGEVKEG